MIKKKIFRGFSAKIRRMKPPPLCHLNFDKLAFDVNTNYSKLLQQAEKVLFQTVSIYSDGEEWGLYFEK